MDLTSVFTKTSLPTLEAYLTHSLHLQNKCGPHLHSKRIKACREQQRTFICNTCRCVLWKSCFTVHSKLFLASRSRHTADTVLLPGAPSPEPRRCSTSYDVGKGSPSDQCFFRGSPKYAGHLVKPTRARSAGDLPALGFRCAIRLHNCTHLDSVHRQHNACIRSESHERCVWNVRVYGKMWERRRCAPHSRTSGLPDYARGSHGYLVDRRLATYL